MEREDVAALGRSLTQEQERDAYRQLREAVMQGPTLAARVLSRILLSNPDKGTDGIWQPFPYQEAFIGYTILHLADYVDALFPTGMGKTHGLGAAEAIRLYTQPENAVIIAPIEKQTTYIRETVKEFYATGHPLLRNSILDSPADQVHVRRPDGGISKLTCATANLNNQGDSLLGLQGITTILLDERALLPDSIYNQKIERITAPQGHRRLVVGITTTQAYNHVYKHVEADQLPLREACNPSKPHITRKGGAVFKSTWRDGVKAGRFDADFIERRYEELGPEEFAVWYECEFSDLGDETPFPPELLAAMVNAPPEGF